MFRKVIFYLGIYVCLSMCVCIVIFRFWLVKLYGIYLKIFWNVWWKVDKWIGIFGIKNYDFVVYLNLIYIYVVNW